jgi:hypothetical protein
MGTAEKPGHGLQLWLRVIQARRWKGPHVAPSVVPLANRLKQTKCLDAAGGPIFHILADTVIIETPIEDVRESSQRRLKVVIDRPLQVGDYRSRGLH